MSSGKQIQHYELNELIGEGSYAKVYAACNTKTEEKVAVKVINTTDISSKTSTKIKREISVMKSLTHTNIVQFYDHIITDDKIYIVMEYLSGGDLLEKVKWSFGLKELLAWKYFTQLIRAVDYFHQKGIAHRDLKLQNLLLDSEGDLKVTDFGLCANSEGLRENGLLHTMCGTNMYMAPEVMTSTEGYVGFSADVYSCGVILYVMVAGEFPYDDSNTPEYVQRACKGDFECPKWIPDNVTQLIRRMMEPNPKKRITIPEIMEHSWLQNVPEGSGRWGIFPREDFVFPRQDLEDIIGKRKLSKLLAECRISYKDVADCGEFDSLRSKIPTTSSGILQFFREIPKTIVSTWKHSVNLVKSIAKVADKTLASDESKETD